MNLNIEQIIARLTSVTKDLQLALKLLKDISKADAVRHEETHRLRALLPKLDRALQQAQTNLATVGDLRKWVAEYGDLLGKIEEDVKRGFGSDLEAILKEQGLSLSGHYPELKAGLFTIEVDFDKSRCVLWYGPRQERLADSRLNVKEVAKLVKAARQSLGSGLATEDIFNNLEIASKRIQGVEDSDRVGIIDVLAEMAVLVQPAKFRANPIRNNYRSYGRADFSYDIFRLKHSSVARKRLQLRVAARAFTSRPSSYLWVPDDEQGNGTTYSHLSITKD